MTAVHTTCPYCGVGCGVLATPGDGYALSVQGDPGHPANFGRLCSKGAALGETVDLEGRLLYPCIDGERVSWDDALGHVAQEFARIVETHGSDAVAFYVSGQLLTEDYYVVNKFIKGYLGTANIDTNSRLCMASSVAGHKRAFGSDAVPGCYEDLELADLVVLVGSNLAWCHPVLYQRLRAAKERSPGKRVIVVDPRRTATCDLADMHLAIKPGSDVALFNGLYAHVFSHGAADFAYLEGHVEGYAQALRAAMEGGASIPGVARQCGLSAEDVARFYREFTATERVVTVYSQGVNQSSSGTDKVNALINCHLALGRIGQPGMGPFSVTGQPNAMGGREVGGLANQLAAHMDFDEVCTDRVRRYWRSPRVATQPGLKAVDMFRAIGEGRIKAVWIMATNPVVSLPDADAVKEALARCELVVVSDCMRYTDTTACAHVLLPALAWAEKDGTVTNSERRISRQRAVLPPPGEAKPDWWSVAQVARRMGYGAHFAYTDASEIFREHAGLTAFENDGARDLDLSAFDQVSRAEYDALTPVQWPARKGEASGSTRLFTDGKFYTPSGKARCIAVSPRAPVNAVDEEYPLSLNTGRVRDHWHTMTRTGKSPRLSAHAPEPYCEMHPQDATQHGVRDDDLVELKTKWGAMLARARLSDAQQRGCVFVPMHWNAQYAASGRVDALVNPVMDPISGQPESKHTPVKLQRYEARCYGFLYTRRPVAIDTGYWVMVRGENYYRYELADRSGRVNWAEWVRTLFRADATSGEWIEYRDPAAGRYRAAWLIDARVEACIHIAATPELPGRDWLAQSFANEKLGADERRSLLTGLAPPGRADPGRVVCSCFAVGINTIVNAIRTQGLATPEAIGRALQAGTGCGSCVAELKSLIAQAR